MNVPDEIGINDTDARAAIGNESDDPFTLQLLQCFADRDSASFISSRQLGDLETSPLFELSRDDVSPYEIPKATVIGLGMFLWKRNWGR